MSTYWFYATSYGWEVLGTPFFDSGITLLPDTGETLFDARRTKIQKAFAKAYMQESLQKGIDLRLMQKKH